MGASEDIHRDGTWALEFQLQPLSGSTRYGLATKYHLSDRSAARFGFLIALETSDGGASSLVDQGGSSGSTTITNQYEVSGDQHSGSVFMHFVRYATIGNHFGLSLDAGPVFGWNWAEASQTTFAPPPSSAERTSTAKTIQKNYGLDFQGGFEWNFTRRLALAGRYGFTLLRNEYSLSYTSDQYDPTTGIGSHYGNEQTSDGYSIETTSSVFSLIAYW